jgi:putative MATE family efflux protein
MTGKTETVSAKTFTIALPVVLQMTMVAALGLIDVLMVSGLGTAATAAVGVASKWHFLIIMIMAGVAGAAGTLIAQFWGAGRHGHAKATYKIALKIGSYIFVPLALLIIFFAPQMVTLQSNDVAVIKLATDYLWFALPVLITTHFILCIEASLRSVGQAWLPLTMSAIGIGLNIVFNNWFIHGGFGLPAMGVAGAALASSVARLIQLLALLGYLKMTNNWLIYLAAAPCSAELRKNYRSVAMPLVINSLVWASGVMVYQMLIGTMGTAELAVFSMLAPFESLCHAVFYGLSVACSVVIGQALGRSQFCYAESISKQFIMLALFGSLLVGMVVGVNNRFVMQLLGIETVELLNLAQPALLVLSLGMWLKMLNLMLINGVLRAGGENSFCLKTDFKAMWLVGIPLAGYGAMVGHWAFEYVYLAMLSEEVVKLAMCMRHYLRRAWQNNLSGGLPIGTN